MKILGASIGECVHIQGVFNFLRMAEDYGHDTDLLGPAISVDELISNIKDKRPDAVAVSYRLTPDNADRLFAELQEKISEHGIDMPILLGGTTPVTEIAKKYRIFTLTTDGSNIKKISDYLSGSDSSRDYLAIPPQSIIRRIEDKEGPILRTHFGLPTVEQTVAGIKKISQSGLLDVISLGIDQDTQANFFHPERQNPAAKGAGGVPVRSPEEFRRLFEATREGNFPLMRAYAGTDDILQMAQMYEEQFGNAWSAVPVFWFNKMDGRGPHDLETSIQEHLKLIRWNTEHNIPVEILESHHWAMRWAHDSLVVASAYLGAEIAKRQGVKEYIHQYMLNVPPESSTSNELAKMRAIHNLVETLKDKDFSVYHQTRAGLPSFPNDLEKARAQLAYSTMLQLSLDPDIIHIVNFSEPSHAATPEDVIASAKIGLHTIKKYGDMPRLSDKKTSDRYQQLNDEAQELLRYIHDTYDIDDPKSLAKIITDGVFDAPMLRNNPYAKGNLKTILTDGKLVSTVPEKERLQSICSRGK